MAIFWAAWQYCRFNSHTCVTTNHCPTVGAHIKDNHKAKMTEAWMGENSRFFFPPRNRAFLAVSRSILLKDAIAFSQKPDGWEQWVTRHVLATFLKLAGRRRNCALQDCAAVDRTGRGGGVLAPWAYARNWPGDSFSSSAQGLVSPLGNVQYVWLHINVVCVCVCVRHT